MQDSLPNTAWYAVAVRPRHEKTVERVLNNKSIQSFVPLYAARRSWSDRVKTLNLPLFSGYVFCRFAMENFVHVLSTPSVSYIVTFDSRPAAIPDEEIAGLRAVLASGLPYGPFSYIHPGQTVRIEAGCFAGLSGTVLREKDHYRLVVSVNLLRRAVAVEIDSDLVRAIQAGHPKAGRPQNPVC